MPGVGGTLSSSSSSLLWFRDFRLGVVGRLPPLTEDGNSDLLGVRAVATLLMDRRMLSLIFHSRFLATKNKAVLATPNTTTTETTTIMAIIALRERSMPLLLPDAPASLFAAEPPALKSPGEAVSPGEGVSLESGKYPVGVGDGDAIVTSSGKGSASGGYEGQGHLKGLNFGPVCWPTLRPMRYRTIQTRGERR